MTEWIDWRIVLLLLVAFDLALILAAGRRGAQPLSRKMSQRIVPELVLIPTAVSMPGRTAIAIIAVVGLVVIVRYKVPGSQPISYLPAVLMLATVALIDRSTAYTSLVLFLGCGLVLIIIATVVPREDAYASLLAGLSLYLAANVLGWLAGIRSPVSNARLSGFETSSSLFEHRVLFPFARSINEPAYIGGALIVAVIVMIKVRQQPRWYHWVGVAAAIVVMLGSNSRISLLATTLLATALVLAPSTTRKVAPYLVGVGLLLPFLTGVLQSAIRWSANIATSSSYLSRGQSLEQIMALNSREIIWSQSIKFWLDHTTSLSTQLFGYGNYGHAKSGAYTYYASAVGHYVREPKLITTHNALLQTLFDGGLLAAVTLFAVVFVAVYRYGRDIDLLPVFAVVTMLGLSGVGDVSIAPGIGHTPAFLLLYLLVFIPNSRTAWTQVRGGWRSKPMSAAPPPPSLDAPQVSRRSVPPPSP